MNRRKIMAKVLAGSKNIRFAEILALAEGFGFRLDRVSGSHHILLHDELNELLNLQPVRGKAKPYQVRQLLKLVEEYNLTLEEEA